MLSKSRKSLVDGPATKLAGLLLLAAGSLASAADYEIVDKAWVRADSDNFTVFTTHEPEVAKQLVRHLELIRSIIPTESQGVVSNTVAPLTIVAFDSQLDYGRFSPNIRLSAALIENTRRQFMLLHDYRGSEFETPASRVYSHLALRATRDVPFPPWLREGFALHLAHASTTPEEVIVGRLQGSLAFRAYLTDLDEQITASTSGTEGRFGNALDAYKVQGLFHYLNFREGGNFWEETVAYLERLDAGEDHLTAFEEAYAVDVDSMRLLVEDHLYEPISPARSYPVTVVAQESDESSRIYPKSSVLDTFRLETRALSRTEAAMLITELSVATGRLKLAERTLNWAIEADGPSPAIDAALGLIYRERRLYEQAKHHLGDALAGSPDQPDYLIELGRTWYEQALHERDPGRRDDGLSRATEYFVKAWQLEPENPDAYAWLGQSVLIADDDKTRAVDLIETAAAIRPENATVQLMLARAYRLVGRESDAMRVAALVYAWPFLDSALAEVAAELLRQGSATGPCAAGCSPGL